MHTFKRTLASQLVSLQAYAFPEYKTFLKEMFKFPKFSFLLNFIIRCWPTCNIDFFSLSLISSLLHCSSSSSSSSWAIRVSSRLLSSAIWALVNIYSRWDVSSIEILQKNKHCSFATFWKLNCWSHPAIHPSPVGPVFLLVQKLPAPLDGWMDGRIDKDRQLYCHCTMYYKILSNPPDA